MESTLLAYTTDALNASLVGSFVSALCFRRSAMCLLDRLFGLVPPAELDTEKPVLRPMPRKAAEELVLGSVLLPVIASNIQAPVLENVFASDASNAKGACCEVDLPPEVANVLWQSGDFKGGYSRPEPFPHQ